MEFAAILKRFREESGLTQVGLANVSGVPVGTIRDYEQGKREPSLSAALKLAIALQRPLDALAGRDRNNPTTATNAEGKSKKRPNKRSEQEDDTPPR
jgi:transcriptional regulator with XRE-family HTH domain